jgi:hypothetical protein
VAISQFIVIEFVVCHLSPLIVIFDNA